MLAFFFATSEVGTGWNKQKKRRKKKKVNN
jgi:hypothetical protein